MMQQYGALTKPVFLLFSLFSMFSFFYEKNTLPWSQPNGFPPVAPKLLEAGGAPA